jgi:tetratricopeptide (TPR) repeat protein
MKRVLLIIPVLLLSLCINAQNIKRGYRHLEKLDYTKAKDEFKKVLITDKQNPAANFGLGLIYGDDKSPMHDIIQSWSHMDVVDKNLKSLTAEDKEIVGEYFANTEVRRSSRSADKKMEHAIGTIEATLIKYIREENNLELTYEIINKFPDFRHYDNVVHIRNHLEFRKYEKRNTLNGYLEFIEKFPDAAQIGKAIKYRNKLAFERVKNINTVEAYEQYMKDYPDAVEFSAAIKGRNSAAFARARRINTLKAYEDFISKYPEALEVAEAKKYQKQLLYEQAKRIKTLEAYNEFIKKYPEGNQYIDIFNLKSQDLGMKFLDRNNITWDNLTWSRSFDNEKNSETSGGIAITSDNKYIVSGTTLQEDSLWNDAWILKLDSEGKMIWNKVIGDKYEDHVCKVAVNSLNDIITLGYTWLSPDSASREVWIFKIDQEGKKVWNRSLGKWDVSSLLINGNNEIFIGGYQCNDSVNNYSVMVINDKGKKLWKRVFTGIGEVNSLALSPDGNIIMAGSKWGIKMDSKGYIIWESVFEPYDSITCVAAANSGEVYFAGIRNSENVVLYKYSPDGYKMWSREFQDLAEVVNISKIICVDDRVISIGNTFLHSFIQTFNSSGNMIANKPLTSRVTLSYIISDHRGNLIIQISTDDINVMKNLGINL